MEQEMNTIVKSNVIELQRSEAMDSNNIVPTIESVVSSSEKEGAVVVDNISNGKPTEKEMTPVPTWENISTFEGASFNSTVVNIINTVIGAGILSIAYSIFSAGVLGSIILIILVMVPSLITTYYLSCATIYTNESVYGVVGSKLSNKAIGCLADITLILLDFGIDVAYMNVLFAQIVDIGTELFGVGDFMKQNKTMISLLVSLFVLFPLCSIKNMDSLKFTSSIAVLCVIIFVVACIYLGFVGISARGWDLKSWPTSMMDLSTAFAVFVLCFCSHVNTCKITAELKYKAPSKPTSKFNSKLSKSVRATTFAYIVCALSYFFVGICGYMAFGNDIQGSILDSLQYSTIWFKPIIRVGYGFVVMFSYPILGFPACNTIDTWVFKQPRSNLRRLIEGFTWVILTFIVAVAIPELVKIFGITGNFCGVLIVFVWPSLYFIFMIKKEAKKPIEMRSTWFKPALYEEIIAWIILVVGIIVCILATGLEIYKL